MGPKNWTVLTIFFYKKMYGHFPAQPKKIGDLITEVAVRRGSTVIIIVNNKQITNNYCMLYYTLYCLFLQVLTFRDSTCIRKKFEAICIKTNRTNRPLVMESRSNSISFHKIYHFQKIRTTVA